VSESSESGHWFHRTSVEIQRWLSSEPKSALTQEMAESVIGAGGVPVRDDHGNAFLHPDDQEYIWELNRSGVDGNDEVR
jgi:hypothetical protein